MSFGCFQLLYRRFFVHSFAISHVSRRRATQTFLTQTFLIMHFHWSTQVTFTTPFDWPNVTVTKPLHVDRKMASAASELVI